MAVFTWSSFCEFCVGAKYKVCIKHPTGEGSCSLLVVTGQEKGSQLLAWLLGLYCKTGLESNNMYPTPQLWFLIKQQLFITLEFFLLFSTVFIAFLDGAFKKVRISFLNNF